MEQFNQWKGVMYGFLFPHVEMTILRLFNWFFFLFLVIPIIS